jgi:pimeloyl-ACP methyl ester carboxylesterase/AcrR family transcriptional regulator
MRELRERTDGVQTKDAIRRLALKLFLRNGYHETTLEEIAHAADISPGDLLRIYPSKTAIVMQDDLDSLVLAAFKAQPPGVNPVAAFRNALRTVLSDVRPEQSAIVRQRALVIRNDPELRAALLTQFGGMVDRVAEVVAGRVGPGPTTLAVRDLAGALVCLIMSITLSASGEPFVELVKRSDEALAELEVSLPLAAMDRDDDRTETHLLRLRDGRLLAYTEWGDEDGDPIIFHHGTPGSRLDHEAAQSLYRSLNVRVITPDRPGYGLSDNKPRRQLVDWPSDVIELADSLRIRRFGVVSLSGGGLYALACAALIPDRLLSVVTTGSPAPFDQPGALAGMQLTHRAGLWLEETVPLIFEGGVSLLSGLIQRHPAYFVDDLTNNSPAADRQVLSTPWVRSSVVATLLEAVRGGSEGYDDDLRILTSPWGFRLEDIAVPVHVWHGEVDAVIPLHQARYLAQTIPGADLTICPGEAHMLLWNHLPEILATATAGRR